MFDELVGLSVERALEIMKLKPNPKSANYARIISTQQSIAASVLPAAVKLAMLRAQKGDKLGEILERVREEEAKR